MQARGKARAWMGALTVALAWGLLLASPTVHEPCPFLTHCPFLPVSWEMAPDRKAVPLVGDLPLSPPKVLPAPLDKPPR